MSRQEIISRAKGDFADKCIDSACSFFRLPCLPEYVTSEMLIASCYKCLGFKGLNDTTVLKNSKMLSSFLDTPGHKPIAPFNDEDLSKLLRDVLLSPQDENQPRNKYPDYLFLTPLVPHTACFSNPIRLRKNPELGAGGTSWNAVRFFEATVSATADSDEDARRIWGALFNAFSIEEQDGLEDTFAKVVEETLLRCESEIEALKPGVVKFPRWEYNAESLAASFSKDKRYVSYADKKLLDEYSPLPEIRRSLTAVIGLKPMFSRWQWLTMMDSVCRMSVISYFIWVLTMQHAFAVLLEKIVRGQYPYASGPVTIASYLAEISSIVGGEAVFSYGESTARKLKDFIAQYAKDRVVVALAFSVVEDHNHEALEGLDFSTLSQMALSLEKIRSLFGQEDYRSDYVACVSGLLSASSESLNLTKGRFRHIDEFFRLIRQKVVVASQNDFIRYDQSYMSRKRGSYKSAPYIFDFGSVVCFVTAFCAARGRALFPYREYVEYLRKFSVGVGGSQQQSFQAKLKGLCLTMDSPDACDEVSIRNPFFEGGRNVD